MDLAIHLAAVKFPINHGVNLECRAALFISISLLGCSAVVGSKNDVAHKEKSMIFFNAVLVVGGGVADRLYQLFWKIESWKSDYKCLTEMIFLGHLFFCGSTIFFMQ